MADSKQIVFPCLELEQPIGVFYVGVMEAADVVQIAYADVRRIEARDIERVVGLQRELNHDRVRELQDYVKTIDSSFPTSIILAIKEDDATFDAKKGTMTVTRGESVAKIIDGQHRIAGLEGFTGKFQVNVTIFVEMDMEDQAMVFATINFKQTKVNKSLVYDLYEYAKARSPQKTCHTIAKLLNAKEGSPFRGMIKILGKATESKGETITQATFVEKMLEYITDSPLKDRDALKRKQKLTKIDATESKNLIFRNMFIEERDAEIAKIVWNYFEAVGRKWKKAWTTRESGNILNRTNGFRGLMRFLRDAYVSLGKPEQIVPVQAFDAIFEKINIHETAFTPFTYAPGTSGESQLHKDLLAKSGLAKK